jgi:hypothetical protein
MQQEIEPAELAHAEADTFWLFEAVMSEVTELQDEEEGNVWPLKLSARVAWADDELFANLVSIRPLAALNLTDGPCEECERPRPCITSLLLVRTFCDLTSLDY